MIEFADACHYAAIVSVVTLPGLGAALGEGIVGGAALDAINKQPSVKGEIAKNAILGMALVETAAVIGIVISFLLLLTPRLPENIFFTSLSHLGIAFAISIPGLVIGLASSLPAKEACLAIARQPFFAQKISRYMLIAQSIIQTPIILGFIIAMFIRNQAATSTHIVDSIRLISSGAAIGFGSIGPAIGLAIFSQVACKGLGANRDAYNSVFSFTFISNAIVESPAIFALIISLFLLRYSSSSYVTLDAFKMIGAALGISLSTIGAGISSGATAAAACKQIIQKPFLYGQLSKVSLFAQGMIDTCAIYALLISLLLIIKVG